MAGIELIMWYALISVAILLLLSSVDEFCFDIIYWLQNLLRKYKYKKYRYQPLEYAVLAAVPEKRIAIMVPCWQEHLVITDMVKHNVPALDYRYYDIFIGVYPNDELTVNAVNTAQKLYNQVHCVVNVKPGPTTKADNLNNVFRYIQEYEKAQGFTYDIFVLHDSEDVIHPTSLKLYNYLVPRKDMVQIPVFPLAISQRFTTYWTYCDEFAENHTKLMRAREAMHGLVPSAGVGTAFSRHALYVLANAEGGAPFNAGTFTEDYSLALRIHLQQLKSIFLTYHLTRTQLEPSRWRLGKIVPKTKKELIATRALFPRRYFAAVRQRARWITGIVLQEWKISGWPGSFATRYTLFHDRKAIVAHVINILGYIVFIYWLSYFFLEKQPTLAEKLAEAPWVFGLIIACTLMMILRLWQRAIAAYKIYGFFAAILSMPRSVASNIINFHAMLRALRQYFFRASKQKNWDKTNNAFPSVAELKSYKRKLGNLLLENHIISPQQLDHALAQQAQSKEQLGKILLKQGSVTEQQIFAALAKQYNLALMEPQALKILPPEAIPHLTNENYTWLFFTKMYPIHCGQGVLTLAITDPTEVSKRKEVVKRLKPYEVQFVLTVANLGKR